MNFFLGLALILLGGMIASRLIGRLSVPAITSYLVLGIIIGPSFLNLIETRIINASGLIANIALGIIAFDLGRIFSLRNFKKIGRNVFWISIFGGILPLAMVSFFLYNYTQNYGVALIYGALAVATAPTAVTMVAREMKAGGEFTDTLLGVVAIDDAWGLIIFAIALVIARAVFVHLPITYFSLIGNVAWQILGAIAFGALLGWLLSYFSHFLRTREEYLISLLGFLFAGMGVALVLHLSIFLTTMVLATVLINLKPTNLRFFEILRNIDTPIFLVFFVLAGINLEIKLLSSIGMIGILYIVWRIIGKISGASVGAYLARASQSMKRYMGLALLPQAGVAIGMALVVKTEIPQIGDYVLTTIVASTVIFEIIGPICTKFALVKSGEVLSREKRKGIEDR